MAHLESPTDNSIAFSGDKVCVREMNKIRQLDNSGQLDLQVMSLQRQPGLDRENS